MTKEKNRKTAKNLKHRLLCPECNEPVVKAGRSAGGAQKYQHSAEMRETCDWKGTRPIGYEKVLTEGIDLKRSKELAKRIIELRKKGMFSVFFFTSAQNATPVHAGFLAAVKSYLKHRHADGNLFVIPLRYKNPTSHWGKIEKSYDWWATEIENCLLSETVKLNRNLTVFGDIKTQPTAGNPLSHFDALSKDKSAIIAHTKIEMKTVATPQNKMAKILLTTGSITKANYTQTKAGKLGEFHHTIGGTVVEVVGRDKFFMRQIYTENDGSFIDINYRYSPDEAPRKLDRPVDALVLGDTHFEAMADNVVEATYGKDGIVPTLKPRVIVHHDAIDFRRRSHHSRRDSIEMAAISMARQDSIDGLLNENAEFLSSNSPSDAINVFVRANHTTEHLKRWFEEADPKADHANSVFWSKSNIALRNPENLKISKKGVHQLDLYAYWMQRKLALLVASNPQERAEFLKYASPLIKAGIDEQKLLELWAEKKISLEGNYKFLKASEPFVRLNVALQFHGDKGPNGSRGSLRSYSNIGIRTIIGHSHSPGIMGGAMQVGMSCEYDMVYEQGAPSGRLQAHGLLYCNGKRTLLIIVDDGWRAEGFKRKRSK